MSGAPPDTLNARHRHVAVLEAAGFSAIEIGEIVGLHPNRISTVRQSPLYQALLQVELHKRAEALRGSVTKTMERLLPMADRAYEDILTQRDNLSVLHATASDVYDRVLPRRVATLPVAPHVSVTITVDDDRRIRETLEQDRAVDVTPPVGLVPLAEAIVDPPTRDSDEEDAA